MTGPAVVGLDLSLTGTGVADAFGATRTLRTPRTGMDRLDRIRSLVSQHLWVQNDWVDMVACEGYSFGSRNSQAHALGELGGVIRMMLHENGVPYADIPPKSLKKYACNNGNANKNEVLVAAVKRLGYDGSSDDEADALWLRAMALDAYGYPVVQMPATHRVALDAVQWPELTATEVAS